MKFGLQYFKLACLFAPNFAAINRGTLILGQKNAPKFGVKDGLFQKRLLSMANTISHGQCLVNKLRYLITRLSSPTQF